MIFQVSMKCPDALDDAIDDATSNIEDEDQRDLEVSKAKRLAEQWFSYSEYVTVEFDTDKKTCVVVKP